MQARGLVLWGVALSLFIPTVVGFWRLGGMCVPGVWLFPCSSALSGGPNFYRKGGRGWANVRGWPCAYPRHLHAVVGSCRPGASFQLSPPLP